MAWPKGQPLSEKHRARIARGNAGTPKTPEHRAKIAAALTGRTRSAEHIANHVASLRANGTYENTREQMMAGRAAAMARVRWSSGDAARRS